MTKILEYKFYYFLGIGGIGMSALARYFNHYKKKCFGYDKTSTELTTQLEHEGIDIHFDENPEYLEYIFSEFKKEEILIIYTPAIPETNKEFAYVKEKEFILKKRSAVLGEIASTYKTIAVAGTHGKTTTATMVTHILKSAKTNCFAFLGGISNNYGTNLILGDEKNTDNTILVVEADEYDRSFLTLNPDGAIITSADPDHLDVYGTADEVTKSFLAFSEKVKPSGCLIVKNSVDNSLRMKNERYTYSVISKPDSESTSFFAKNVRVDQAEFYFDYSSPFSSLSNLHLGIPGDHNVENAVAAAGICEYFGVSGTIIREALDNFRGVKRRFDYRIKKESLVYIDDYAHHPEELQAAIGAAKKLYPNKKITGIFQPHLFSRTRDFANEFAQALDKLDECILLPIYPAREEPIPGVSSEMLLTKMTLKKKEIIAKDEIVESVKKRKIEVLLTMGAGDIDKIVLPLENTLNEIIF